MTWKEWVEFWRLLRGQLQVRETYQHSPCVIIT
jgi:hypothetical protein